jgi:hypothetical protein
MVNQFMVVKVHSWLGLVQHRH